jgi:toxin YoeB
MTENRTANFHQQFREDLAFWVKTDRRVASKILELVEATIRNPFHGIGKPEPLKKSSFWSRRVTHEHRLVYGVYNDRIDFLQCRYHYN